MSFFNKTEELILLNAKSVVVGFSGGVDSTLALIATMQFLEKHNKKSCLTAIHVNHQTQSSSATWQKHCESFCNAHKINFLCKILNIRIIGKKINGATLFKMFLIN